MLIWVYSDITMKVSLREVTGNTYHFLLAMDIYVFCTSPDYLLGWAGLSLGCQSGCFISMFGHLYVLKHMSLILPSWPNLNLTLILLHWPQCKLVGIWNIRIDVVTESRPPDSQAACQGKVGWTEHFFAWVGDSPCPECTEHCPLVYTPITVLLQAISFSNQFYYSLTSHNKN